MDRTASYMARYIAKNIVAADLADACEVQLSYAIGVAQPISVLVDTEGTAKIDESEIENIGRKFFPLTPKGMIHHLETATSDLPGNRPQRPFWPKSSRLHLGKNRYGQTKLRKAAGLNR